MVYPNIQLRSLFLPEVSLDWLAATNVALLIGHWVSCESSGAEEAISRMCTPTNTLVSVATKKHTTKKSIKIFKTDHKTLYGVTQSRKKQDVYRALSTLNSRAFL